MKWKFVSTLVVLTCLILQATPVMVAGGTTGISGTIPLETRDISASNISYHSAVISWKTNGNSTSQMFYDTDSHDNLTDYAHQTSESLSLVLTHNVNLTGLASGTTYRYRAKSRIPETDFMAVSADYTFTTLAPQAERGVSGGPLPGTTDVSDIVTSQGVFTKTVAFKSADAKVEVTIPKDTIGKTKEGTRLTILTVVPMTTPPAVPTEYNVIGLTYDLGPEGAIFAPPISIKFSYDPAQIPAGVNEADLVLAFYDKATGQWVELSDIVVDPVTQTISGKTSHFTAFSVIAYTRAAVFTISDLNISPTELKVGERVSIGVNIANTGDLAGTSSVTLKVNSIVIETKQITLTGHSSQKITFTTSRDAAGTYAVSIGPLSSTFTVKAGPIPAAFLVTNLSIQPTQVQPKEVVTITMLVSNTSGTEGSLAVVLTINGMKEAEKSVTVGAGKSREISFSVTRENAGSYSVVVEGLSGSFTIQSPPEVPVVKPWLLIGGIIASAAVVVGLVVFFLLRRRRSL